jgi:hypothetical protein
MTIGDRDKTLSVNSAEERVLELAERVFLEAASSEEMAELESLLSAAPGLRRIYLRYALLQSQLAFTTASLCGDISLQPTAEVHSTLRPSRTLRDTLVLAAMLAAALLISVGVYFSRSTTDKPDLVSDYTEELSSGAMLARHYDNRDLPTHVVGFLVSERSKNIFSSTLHVHEGSTGLRTTGGIDIQIEGPAKFGASSSTTGVLYQGSVLASLNRQDSNYSIETNGLRVVDRGTEFRVATMEKNQIRVEVLDGEVEVQSRIRRPLYLWSFDESASKDNKTVTDSQFISRRVERVPGLVGTGAISFSNQNDSFVRIIAGTGKEVGTGAMACSSGISIEAIIVSQWDGKEIDYDEIFRKEDGNHRMLLSFQNDGSPFGYEIPKVASGPCLSFGLHLDQHGYSELDMPLDGNDGRPALQEIADGKPHHVVATYDSFTGRKSIFIDGLIRFSHDFTDGALVLNGGPALAEIGNHESFEPFTGIIDEVAYYDFALTPDEIAVHYERAMRGLPYYEQQSRVTNHDRWQAIAIVRAGSSRVFDITTENHPPGTRDH